MRTALSLEIFSPINPLWAILEGSKTQNPKPWRYRAWMASFFCCSEAFKSAEAFSFLRACSSFELLEFRGLGLCELYGVLTVSGFQKFC